MSDVDSPSNPCAPEDGMIRCPRKAGSAIATGRCAQMRDADLCGKCRGLKEEAPQGTPEAPSWYRPKYPYTEDCHHRGHKPSSGHHGCLTCSSVAAGKLTRSAPACAHSRAGEHLAECPVGIEQGSLRTDGCYYQGTRKNCVGKPVSICLFRPDGPGKQRRRR